MSAELYQRIRVNPKFIKLVQERGRFQWTLSAVVLIMFYGYFMVIAFAPSLLGQKIAEGSMWPVGYTIELFLFVFFWFTTLYYVNRSNKVYDHMAKDVLKEAEKETK